MVTAILEEWYSNYMLARESTIEVLSGSLDSRSVEGAPAPSGQGRPIQPPTNCISHIN